MLSNAARETDTTQSHYTPSFSRRWVVGLLAYLVNANGRVARVIEEILSPALAMIYRHMFQNWRRLDYLQRSIHYSLIALASTPNKHPRLPHYQQRLAISLRDRFRRTGSIHDLYSAIMLQKSALQSTCHNKNPPDINWHQQNLAVSYLDLWQRHENREDLNNVLDLSQRALSLLPERSSKSLWWMATLASTYQRLYMTTGSMEHLALGVQWATIAVNDTPVNDPRLPIRQVILAHLLLDKFMTNSESNIEDIDHALELTSAALSTTTPGTLQHASWSMSLALLYSNRYDVLFRLEDLDLAHQNGTNAIGNIPRSHPTYAQCCHNMGSQLLQKYRRDGDVADLQLALRYTQDALDITPKNHRFIGIFKGQIAIIYTYFYQQFGYMGDLETAVEYGESAVSTLPATHVKLAVHQHSLSILYFLRYRRHRDVQFLERALHMHRCALQKTPQTALFYIDYLHHLALLQQVKFRLSGDVKELDEATTLMQRVIDKTSTNDPKLPSRYDCLALLYSTRYKYLGGTENRDVIIKWNLAGVEAAERLKDPELPTMQNSLALQYFNRYIWLRDEHDLDSALIFAAKSTKNTPKDHFYGPFRYTTLAEVYAEKYALDHQEELAKFAFDTYHHASTFPSASPETQWILAQKWSMFADSISSPDSLNAYIYAFRILPTLLWLGTSITTRHEALVKYDIANVAAKAVTACIRLDKYDMAVEFLEQSLSMTFNQMLGLQTDLTELNENHPELAGHLHDISDELRHFTTLVDDKGLAGDGSTLPNNLDKIRKLALERDELIGRIRLLTKFQHFLLPIPYQQLRQAASYGPVVMINCSEHHCDALIMIGSDGPGPFTIRLFNANAKALQRQHQLLKTVLKSLGINTRDLRGGRLTRKNKSHEQVVLDEILEWLWKWVVHPVYEVLHVNGIMGGRLWWCVTGPLTCLPLHAAGPVNKFIPSYTPTLSGLIRARKHPQNGHCDITKLSVIGISQSPVHTQYAVLPSVIKEIKAITECIKPTILLDADATVAKVMDELSRSQWIHLACHGQQGGANDPLGSCLLLHDGKIHLKQLLNMPLPDAEFAFLSACETAMGDTELSNEALHLAGGMLFAGFKAAIATLWSINDEDGPVVARIVYRNLFAEGRKGSVYDTAEALQNAVNHLRNMGIPSYRWLPFIHIGI